MPHSHLMTQQQRGLYRGSLMMSHDPVYENSKCSLTMLRLNGNSSNQSIITPLWPPLFQTNQLSRKKFTEMLTWQANKEFQQLHEKIHFLKPVTLRPCLTTSVHHVHEVIMKQLGKNCDYKQCVINRFSWTQEAPVGPYVRVRLISSSSLGRPCSHHCDCAI